MPPVPGVPYVLWLIPGIVPWFYYSEALKLRDRVPAGVQLSGEKVVFQVEILPIIKLISHAGACVFAGIMLAVFLCYGRLPMAT